MCHWGGELSCLALSRDGSKVAAGTSIGATFPSADDDGLVVLCAVSGVVLHRIRARQFTTVVNTVAFVAPDRLATGSNDSRLRLWRLSGPGGGARTGALGRGPPQINGGPAERHRM